MQFNSEKFECLRLWPGNTAIPEFDYLGPDYQPIQGPGCSPEYRPLFQGTGREGCGSCL